MKIKKTIYYYIPRILVGLSIMCAAIYMFFTHGIIFAVIPPLIPVFWHYYPKLKLKLKHMNTKFVREIDESGDHYE